MPKKRMKMRQWLEQIIESNSISGVTWIDKDKTMFSIPWKHAARHGWEMDKDAWLFKKWAIHTGKYVEGQACDAKTWKTNFRCAMHSLSDVEEVKDRSINKGDQAVRVYRMLPVSNKPRDKGNKANKFKSRKKIKNEKDVDYSGTQSPAADISHDDTSFTQENTVDSTVNIKHQDVTYMSPSKVPEFSSMVEISDTLPHLFCHRIEVSANHSPDYDYHADINKQLEKDSSRMLSCLDGKGFLSNEARTSPGSQWSESSSAEEVDELQYTMLGSDLTTTDGLGNSFFPEMTSIVLGRHAAHFGPCTPPPTSEVLFLSAVSPHLC